MNRFEEVGGDTNEETTAKSTRKGGREVDEPKLLSPYRGSSFYDSITRSMSETRSGFLKGSRGTYIMALDLDNCIGFGADTRGLSAQSNYKRKDMVVLDPQFGIKREELHCKIRVVGRLVLAICGLNGFGLNLQNMMSQMMHLEDSSDTIREKLIYSMEEIKKVMPELQIHPSGAIAGYYDFSHGEPIPVIFECNAWECSVTQIYHGFSFGGGCFDNMYEYVRRNYNRQMGRDRGSALIDKCVCLASGTAENLTPPGCHPLVGGKLCGAALMNVKEFGGQCIPADRGAILPEYF